MPPTEDKKQNPKREFLTQKDIDSPTLQSSEDKKNNIKKKVISILLVIVGLVSIAAGTTIFYKSVIQKPEEPKIPTPTEPVQPVQIATPTPPEINPANYSVQILNGSGIAGEAGKVETLLKNVGFENFNKGNADSFDYIETVVSLKPDTPGKVFEKIKEALPDYTVTKSPDNLEENSKYDAQVTVGQKSSDSEEE